MATKRSTRKAARAKRVKRAFHEVKHKPPAIVSHTARKFGKSRAQKQRVAIALRKAGVARKRSGSAKRSGKKRR